MIGVLLGALSIQQHILRNSNYGAYRSEQSETKKQYYKLLKLKPMFIKLNVSSHGSQFLPQLINVSMIKEIRGGFTELNGVTPDKWCVAKFIDGDEQWVEGELEDLQSKIWSEQDRTIDVRIRNRSGLGPF
jgi:hypothetical protein